MEDKNRGRSGRDQKTSDRNIGNNTTDNQRAADEMTKGDKDKQQQGNHGSRQGEGGNRGKRGNRGLG